jgi:hypothetical protein
MNYHEKYLKYKIKYLSIVNILSTGDKINLSESDNTMHNDITNEQDDITNEQDDITLIQDGGSSKYMCNPNKYKYIQTCTENTKGNYSTQKDCEKDCDPKFISIQLKKANLYKESLQFYFFIQDLINKEQMSIYIKGGNVIGLAVLKLVYDTYKNNDKKFSHVFNRFLKMELIKDWDFTAYTHNQEITTQYRAKLDKIADKQKLVPRAKTFVLYQTKQPILVYDKALFEIAILDSDSTDFSKMEIPMTTMKVRVNLSNIKYIFMLAKSFYSYKQKHIPIDLEIVKKILSTIEIVVHPHKSGLYDPNKKLDTGELNKDLVKFINNFTHGDIFWTQFLITQLEDPYRLIYRMCEKNITKTDKIRDFIKKYTRTNKYPSWLLDTNKTMGIINRFIGEFGKKLVQIYAQTKNLDKVLNFLSGANFGKPQIQIEWGEFNQETKSRLKRIFQPVVHEIGYVKFVEMIKLLISKQSSKSSDLTSSDKIIKLFGFLIEKKFFEK